MYLLKPTISICGSHLKGTGLKYDLAYQVGSCLAEKDINLVTGSSTGLPDVTNKGYVNNPKRKGVVIGISPFRNLEDQLANPENLTAENLDFIIYTRVGMGLPYPECYIVRDIFVIDACDAAVVLPGHGGTIDEVTQCLEHKKPMAIMTGIDKDFDKEIDKVISGTKVWTYRDDRPEILVDNLMKYIEVK